MAEVKRLTKVELLKGKENVEYVYFQELDGELPLKPLTDGQWAQVRTVRFSGMTAKGKPGSKNPDMEFEIGKLREQAYEASVLAVSFAIADGETWTVDDVKSLKPAGIVEKIAKEVFRITGVNPDIGAEFTKEQEKEAKNFRKK